MRGAGMNYRSLVGNALTAFAAQGISMLVSAAMTLLAPKVMGVVSYGYWQLFVFYVGYSGFFHLGLNDGIYLIEGGRTREEIDKKAVNSQVAFGVVFQMLVVVVIAAVAVVWAPEAERAFVLFAFAAYTAVYNLSSMLGYIFQAMNETKLFSFSTMLERLLFLVPMLGMVLLDVSDFRPFIIAYFIARCASLVYCCWKARDILGAGLLSFSESIRLSLSSIKVGFSLMVAGVADMLILGVARGLVDYAWGIEAFAKVSLSLSLVNFFITFVSQASMVLFPALRQGTDAERRRFYKLLKDGAEIVFPAAYLLYIPSVIILTLWLPQYAESMRYFAMLLPICAFNTKMDLSCTTYFKVLREERLLLKVNIITVAASAVLSFAGIYLLHSLDAVLLGAVACIVGRSLWCEGHLDGKIGFPREALAFEEVLLTVVFVVTSLLLPAEVAFVVYACSYAAYLFANRKAVHVLFAPIRRRLSK